VAEVKAHVGDVLLVDDGMPAGGAAALARLAAEAGVGLLRLPANCGKGHAIAAGKRHLLGRVPAPQAVVVLDADGQHPTSSIPALLAAASEAELVIGDRLADLGMPPLRRFTNRLTSRLLALVTGHPVPDSQCGMRLLRGRALREVEFPGGRYEAETLHLKRCLRSGVRVAWVPIPALYGGQPSSFRGVRDGTRVLGALLRA
jgi:Glycosyl transferase family 2